MAFAQVQRCRLVELFDPFDLEARYDHTGKKLALSVTVFPPSSPKPTNGRRGRSRQPYSFLPNLVWLPAQLAKLTDREGGFAQTLLQALSLSLYRRVPLTPGLAAIVDPIWETLPVREEVEEISVPLDRLSFFELDEGWLGRRQRTLSTVHAALTGVRDGSSGKSKVVSSRYGAGLRDLNGAAVSELLDHLSSYAEAVDEATAPTADLRPLARAPRRRANPQAASPKPRRLR